MKSISPALKSETIRIAVGSAVGTVVMWLVYLILHQVWPGRVPFDYRVVLSGLGGTAIAVLNFFMMGMAVQKVASETDQKQAYRWMQLSQRQRFLLMIVWVIAALTAPCFDKVAAIIPLLFPSMVIKIYYLTFGKGSLNNQKPAQQESEEGSEE